MQDFSSNHVSERLTSPRPKLHQRGIISALGEICETLLTIITVYIFVNLVTARFIVDGASMQPNFETGQFLLVSRVHYLFSAPERGDIVVFHYPRDPENDYIKRVIGLPGERVALRDQRVYVNDVLLDEPYINGDCSAYACVDNMWQVGETEYFVMGDNRNNSSDSRDFGPVDQRFLVGEALIWYWPPMDWGSISSIRYVENATP